MSPPPEKYPFSVERGQQIDPFEIDTPLVVDLDGTLVHTDLLVESFLTLIKQNPLYLFAVLFWLFRGEAYLKRQISRRVDLDVSVLPFHQELLGHLREQRVLGRRIVLATGTDEQIARQVADHLGLFDQVLGSDGTTNLSGRRKRDRLVKEFGEKKFDYAGNGRGDIPVWSSARKAILVNVPGNLLGVATRTVEVERVFPVRKKGIKPYVEALRLHQWLKNLLVFIPLVMAHRFLEPDLIVKNLIAFLAFGLCASSVYLSNDLIDLSADRHHPRKRERPFAAGDLSPLFGLLASPCLLGLSLLVSLVLPSNFFWMVLIYYLLNLAYSFYVKQVALLDVILLAGLYTMRIMAGSASVDIWPSSWLLAFSTFIFLSLALVKRYDELVIMHAETGKVRVRGYQIIDKELLASLGSGSGYVAVLVLAIYISSGKAEILYTRHHFIWLLCPLLLYWISYVWLIAHRGIMLDDPLVFALKDRVSQITLFLAGVVFLLAM
ncbi:MAG TPA: UbiA family prenyltransferase [Thermodesulfobacteriota bacterium]|nr:UbiA family prenyltransferase [Thermodesulfobacteriota bacterium]